jgi:hypothetical protein
MLLVALAKKACRFALSTGLALAAVACKSQGGAGALAKAEPEQNPFADVPAPPADGPKLFALRDATPILDRPGTDGKRLGEIAVGATVTRSKEPYGKKGCDGGWYAVRPKGFACAGSGAVLKLGAGRALPAGPDLARALPYRYGRAKFEGVPVYARVPSWTEQLAVEPDLARKSRARAGEAEALLGAAANDVPLDARGAPTGPPVLLAGGEGIEGGRRTATAFFTFPAAASPTGSAAAAAAANGGTSDKSAKSANGAAVPAVAMGAEASAEAGGPGAEVKVGALRKGSGVALTGTFVSGEEGAGGSARRFGVTLDGRLVPTDRLKPALGTTFHGLELDKAGLPVAFVHKFGVHAWSMHGGKAQKNEDDLERRAAIPMSGRFRTVDGVRYEESREGDWLRSTDIVVVVKRHKFPEFVKGNQKWLDVSLATQTLTAYEGTKPVFVTLISSGKDQLKDPATTASTVRGVFQVQSKHVTRARDAREAGAGFDVGDAPWVMEFEPGFALTGVYWGDVVGEARGFHDIGLSPIDAHRLFGWADPPLPEGWGSVYGAMSEATTFVNVRP